MSTFFINTNLENADRFDMSAFLEYTDNYDPLNSEFLRLLPTLESNGRFAVQSEIMRPDLISYSIYKDTQYWWIIMMYNNIFEIADIQIGLILDYPSLSDLEGLYFSLKSKEG